MIQSFQFSVAKTEACRFNDLGKAIELDSGISGPETYYIISHSNPKYYNIGIDNVGKRSLQFSLRRGYISILIVIYILY